MRDTTIPDHGPAAGAGAVEGCDVDQEWLEEWSHLSADEAGPQHVDDARFSAEELLAVRGPVSEWDLALLMSIDPSMLSAQGRLEFVRRVEAVESLVAACKARGLVALAGADGSDSTRDRQVAMEVALVRRVGEGVAQSSIANARALHGEFPQFLAALSAGEVSEWHCRVLVTETAHVTDRDVLAALQARLLPKARRKTASEFRREVRRAVADLDAARAAERHVVARADRSVSCTPLPDGMGQLGIVSDWPTISAMHEQVRADGRALQLACGGAAAARGGDEDAFADACRADALAARVLGAEQPDGSVVLAPTDVPVALTLVMDLDTLRGEADRHALLDGQPIPAEVARDYADAATLWRRAVTDPVTGHLLDYGREQYLPARLRDYVLARDHCRVPGCTTRTVSRLQMDHAVPFPDGGTSAPNCGGLCRRHHQLKTDRLADLLDTAADGSATWLTAWGQRITIPPRPFLHDPTDHPSRHEHRAAAPTPTDPDPPEDDPPF